MNEANADALDPRQLFEQNCPEYYKFLLHFLSRLIGNKTEAEELTQETFLNFQVFMERHEWKWEVKSFRAYLVTTAIHLRKDAWRGKDLWKGLREEGSVDYDDEQSDRVRKVLDREAMQSNNPTSNIESGILFKELFKSLPLKTILSGLDPYQLEILWLKEVEELTLEEIAQRVHKETAQVRYDLQKLDAAFRYRVRKLFGKAGQKPF
jgi:RNA polymerase sigma factor (sigma-70 family)